jgi:hypothetical protein
MSVGIPNGVLQSITEALAALKFDLGLVRRDTKSMERATTLNASAAMRADKRDLVNRLLAGLNLSTTPIIIGPEKPQKTKKSKAFDWNNDVKNEKKEDDSYGPLQNLISKMKLKEKDIVAVNVANGQRYSPVFDTSREETVSDRLGGTKKLYSERVFTLRSSLNVHNENVVEIRPITGATDLVLLDKWVCVWAFEYFACFVTISPFVRSTRFRRTSRSRARLCALPLK